MDEKRRKYEHKFSFEDTESVVRVFTDALRAGDIDFCTALIDVAGWRWKLGINKAADRGKKNSDIFWNMCDVLFEYRRRIGFPLWESHQHYLYYYKLMEL